MIVYSKSNPHRKPEHAIVTEFHKTDQGVVVIKRATTDAAVAHIDAMERAQKKAEQHLQGWIIAPATRNTPDEIQFPYYTEPTLHSRLLSATLQHNTEQVQRIFWDYIALLKQSETVSTKPLTSPLFEGVQFSQNTIFDHGCIDLNMDNILLAEDGQGAPILIDYEWAMDTEIPSHYVLWRGIVYAYRTMQYFGINNILSLDTIFAHAGITPEDEQHAATVELRFQQTLSSNPSALTLADVTTQFIENTRKAVPQNTIANSSTSLAQYNAIQQHAATVDAEYQKALEVVQVQQDQITTMEETTRALQESAAQKDALLEQKDAEIAWMQASIFWRMRGVYMRMRGISFKHARSLLMKTVHVLRSKGPLAVLRYAIKYARHGRAAFIPHTVAATDYEEWIAFVEQYDQQRVQQDIVDFAIQPKISVITPVYNVDPQWLNACIQSVVDQWYDNWELCLHDDASTSPATVETLKQWVGKDERIKISFGETNQHICGASNSALEMATGDYISLLDCDDAIAPFALYEMVKAINDNPESEFIYSDEDKIDTDNRRLNPFFKPDWSPDLLRSVNYITHMVCIKRELGESVGWFRKDTQGAQDYDLFLRCAAKTEGPIVHVPKILYHWRMIETSTASDAGTKTYAHTSGTKALTDHLRETGVPFDRIDQGVGMTNYRVQYTLPENALVSIIIPFKDKPELLKQCIESILTKSTYQNYELLLINNNSSESTTAEYLESLKTRDERIQILDHHVPFNYSEINNWAARQASGDYLLLLNNDTEVITSNWIEEMLMHAARPEVGAVGAKLLYPNGSIQHAGIILGMTGLAGHIFARQNPEQTYYRLSEFTRNYLAVTAACLMIAKEKYWEVGGLNEEFTVCGNDVNLGLDLHERGYYNLYTPYAELYHYESMTRDKTPPAGDFAVSKERYKPYLNWNDPYYSPHLTLIDESMQLRTKEEYLHGQPPL